MSRVAVPVLTRVVCLAAVALAARVRAQPPAPASASASVPAFPPTPAGGALRAWLDAFNSADAARLGAYARRFQPDLDVGDELDFREQTGGFDLRTVERSEPRHLEFTVRERKGPTTAYGVVDVSAAEPPRVVTRRLQAMGPNVAAWHRIDEHFMIGVPGRRAVNPVTHTNWEGTGVEPDVKTPAGEAPLREAPLREAPRP